MEAAPTSTKNAKKTEVSVKHNLTVVGGLRASERASDSVPLVLVTNMAHVEVG